MNAAEVKKEINLQFSNWYFQNRDRLVTASNSVFNKYRPEAMEAFISAGIPDKSVENYKYTDLSQAFLTPYNKYIEPKKILFSVEDMFQCDIPNLDTEVLLLVNGWYHTNQPPLQKLDNGVIMGSLAQAAIEYPDIVEQHYGQYADYKKDSLIALNTSFAQDGLFLYVPKNADAEQAIQIVNILLSPEDLFVQHRNLIVVEEGAKAIVVVCDHSLNGKKYLTNAVTEVFVGNNAHLEFYKVQNEHNDSKQLSTTHFQQERDSRVNFNTITLHGGLIRNNVYAKLNGSGAENHTLGLFLADQKQHVDSFTFIDHAVPDCFSNQNFKGILDDQATGAFTGKILVRKDAQRTIAYQTNNNICLSNDAKMNTKPVLEIYADDVKCSHGATVGQLDMSAMFYLQSRGIPQREARLLLMYAFGYELLKDIQIEPLKLRLDDLVDKRLRGELSRCNSCPLHCS